MNEKGTLEKPSFLTVKNVLRVLAILCIVFVFCPAFLVSCTGKEIEIGVMTAVNGIDAYGEQVVEPQPIMLVCLMLPLLVLGVSFLKKLGDSIIAGIILGVTVADLVVWYTFKTTVQEKAEEAYCSFAATEWYYINMLILILMLILSVLLLLKKFIKNK